MPSIPIYPKYLYSFKYDYHHNELCKLESRQLFNQEEKDNVLFSDLQIDPSISPFIKNRLEIITSATSYLELLENVEKEQIRMNLFKAEYLILNDDKADFAERKVKLKDIGYCIEGEPDFASPSIIYSICQYENTWYFGVLNKQDTGWLKHNDKPCSFSNSIDMKIAKTLVSIASKGNKNTQLLDACCGVGTIMLEACYAKFNMEGCEINFKACTNANENLAHFNYNAYVHYSDVKDLNKTYDAAIVDLPYNLYSYSNDDITLNIIQSTAKLANHLVIVSIADIAATIEVCGLKVIDFCTVEKRGKSTFSRNIWVCEKI